jgi:predicted aconitase with swiveling domain
MTRFAGRPLVVGVAAGIALVTNTPLSFWGGVDPRTGEVIDRRHPLDGEVITNRILVLPSGRGSCSASGVLLESISNGTAPAAIVVSEIDPIIGLGAILGDELLGRTVPVVLLKPDERAAIPTGVTVHISRGGVVELGLDNGSSE